MNRRNDRWLVRFDPSCCKDGADTHRCSTAEFSTECERRTHDASANQGIRRRGRLQQLGVRMATNCKMNSSRPALLQESARFAATRVQRRLTHADRSKAFSIDVPMAARKRAMRRRYISAMGTGCRPAGVGPVIGPRNVNAN
jgi:hypothetical protein